MKVRILCVVLAGMLAGGAFANGNEDLVYYSNVKVSNDSDSPELRGLDIWGYQYGGFEADDGCLDLGGVYVPHNYLFWMPTFTVSTIVKKNAHQNTHASANNFSSSNASLASRGEGGGPNGGLSHTHKIFVGFVRRLGLT